MYYANYVPTKFQRYFVYIVQYYLSYLENFGWQNFIFEHLIGKKKYIFNKAIHVHTLSQNFRKIHQKYTS